MVDRWSGFGTCSVAGVREWGVSILLELRKQGLQVERQMPIRIYYDELVFDEGFRASLQPWRPLRELACGEEAGATAGSHAKDAKGAKERDNRSRVMGQTSLARRTSQVDAVGL
jgi:hypothetical protein